MERAPFSTARMAALAALWFATGAELAGLNFVLLPREVLARGGEAHKGATVGAIMAGGALVSLIVGPLVGAWSDRVRTGWGRRVPFIVAGALVQAAALSAMGVLAARWPTAHLAAFGAAYVAVQLGFNLANAPYSALVPDLISPERRGVASAWLMVMNLIGSAAGAGVGAALPRLGEAATYRALGALVLACAFLSSAVASSAVAREPAPPPMPPFRLRAFLAGLAAPFRASRDFRWVFGTRFLFMMGIFTVQGFVLFYFKDVVRVYAVGGRTLATTAEAGVSLFLALSLLGAVVSSVPGGVIADRHGRKRLVFASSLLQALVAGVFIVTGRFSAVLAAGFSFGVGMGAYQVADWALAADVLPTAADHGRDMSVWSVSLVLPSVLATPVGGVILDACQRRGAALGMPTLGYSVLFAVAVAYFALGTLFVSRIRAR